MDATHPLAPCRVCPRQCGVNRLAGETGFCGAGRQLHVSWTGLHFGEEPCFTGAGGVGNIFFMGCNMACVYCQNYQISQERAAGVPMSAEAFTSAALDLQEQGAEFLGLVSPSHQIPMIREGLCAAKKAGMRLPVLYNSSAYDNPAMLRTLEGLVDVFLPDLKYADDAMAAKYSSAPGYTMAARAAILEMHRQAGDMVLDPDSGLARRGLWARILVLPNNIAGVWESLCFLALEVSPRIGVSIMAQYAPRHQAARHPEINRRISREEYEEAASMAQDLGFAHIVLQDLESSPENAAPDFSDPEGPFRSF